MKTLLAKDRQNVVLAAAFVALTSVGALQIIAAHARHPLLLMFLYALLLAFVCFFLLFRPLPAFLRTAVARPWLWVLVLCAMMAVDARHYARTLHSPTPMTTSLAITGPGTALLHGRDPYGVVLPLGAPISPGPGWIILLLPLTATHAIALLDGLALLIAALLLGRTSRVAGGLLIVLSLLQPMFLSEAANAQDLFVISLALTALCWVLGTIQLTAWNVLWLGVLSGFVATSRVPILLFFAVLAAGTWKRSRRAGTLYAATTFAVCVALHTAFAFWARHSGDLYQPLHVFRRGSGGGLLEPVLAGLMMLAAAAIAWRSLNADPVTWMLACWLTMTALFAPIGLRELAAAHFNWGWEGDNYIAFPLPLLVAAIALRAGRHTLHDPA